FGYRSVYQSGLTEAQLRETYAHHLRPGGMGPLAERTQQELAEQLARQLAELTPDAEGWCEVELLDFVGRCVFIGGVIAMFGRGPVDDAMHARFVRYDRQFARMVAGVPLRLLGTAREDREALVEALREPWAAASAFVEERRALLGRYVDDVEGARVRLSMLWASQANTIPAAFWAVAFLLEEPAALRAIEAEVHAGVSRDEQGRPRIDPADRHGWRHLDSAILETLRLCAGGTSIRTVTQPLTLELHGGRRCALRPGDNVAVFPFLSHRDPEIFEDPERFTFDRFLAERGRQRFSKQGERLGFALMPFGGGETMCPGRFLAQSEIKMLVAMLLADYELRPAPGQARPSFDLSRSGLGILPPAGPLRVQLRPRVAA
ncbi:MAG: cytochrome P450, partial [Myxococcales bacterium]|nr:cytochrome P450 [Myxococcales bacterium]